MILRALSASAFCILLTNSVETPLLAEAPAGFEPLFNQQDLSGWQGIGHQNPYQLAEMSPEARQELFDQNRADMEAHWTVEDGELVNDGAGVYLTTAREFGDCELRLDYKTVALADSGVYLRGTPQVQIWDTTEAGGKWDIGAKLGSGGLWNNLPGAPGKDPLVLADRPFGEWNTLRVIQVGERTSVWLNDQLVVDHARMDNYWDRSLPLPRRGPIQLQTHGGEIRWRKLSVRELPVAEANERLRARTGEGWKPIFNGRDLHGWQGATDSYEVKDGTLVCQAGKGGTLFTEATYADFVLRFEFKLPSRGNNGLAIRYPGQGDAAYTGMCELQILDTPRYAGEIDPRQAHGSAYGMVAAHTGYLREPGEWNSQQVTVRGSEILVELNGTVILETDLESVTEFLGDKPHPGRQLRRGHLGFAGHGDPVQFRNIWVKPL
ncbi:MAG: DUF1080 domain-containing protein [Planctomycetota bacterium]